MKWSLARIAHCLSGAGEFQGDAVAQGYSLDSRSIQTGEIFFAVKGERLDGHDFVECALERGALAAIVQRSEFQRYASPRNLIVVEDTILALQKLATCMRREWGQPLIAVTGSAGKTTTKEMIAALLAARFKVHKSEGNLNNHFGLPLQLLRLEPEHEIAVVELGMSHPGEITALARIAQPQMGVVTCVAPVHLEFFRSMAAIAKAKQELIDSLPPTGTAVLNADDEYVSQFGMQFRGKVVMYGIRRPADVRAENVQQHGLNGSEFTLATCDARETVHLPLVGQHNIYNVLAACAVAVQHGVSVVDAASVLAKIRPVEKRGQTVEIAGATVINDCYNSNPRALDSMIDALAGMVPGQGGRRILVAGEMLELGPASEDLHRRCGAHAAERGIDVVLGVRGSARLIVEGAKQTSKEIRTEFVESPVKAGEWLSREVKAGDIVLLKASRGVKLEGALETWKELSEVLSARS